MKKASVRELRQDFPRLLAWIQAGEEIIITLRRQAVARLTPCLKKKTTQPKIPDLAARLQKVFGSKVITDETMSSLMDRNRGDL